MTARSPKPSRVGDGLSVLAEAWGLFIFSGLFALLFNLFYTEGIELKVKPLKQPRLQEVLKSQPAATYPGWGSPTPPSPRPTAAAGAPPTVTGDNLPRLSLIGAKDRFDRKTAIFLDARSPDEYKQGHIPGALDFYADDFEKMAPQVLPQLPDKTREIIAYCHGTSCDLSIHLGQKLSEQGYTNVKVFFGGWPEWKKAGFPINTGDQP
jgi:rhodanese-related sulfurtransferase